MEKRISELLDRLVTAVLTMVGLLLAIASYDQESFPLTILFGSFALLGLSTLISDSIQIKIDYLTEDIKNKENSNN